MSVSLLGPLVEVFYSMEVRQGVSTVKKFKLGPICPNVWEPATIRKRSDIVTLPALGCSIRSQHHDKHTVVVLVRFVPKAIHGYVAAGFKAAIVQKYPCVCVVDCQ